MKPKRGASDPCYVTSPTPLHLYVSHPRLLIDLHNRRKNMSAKKSPNSNGETTQITERYSVFTQVEKWCIIALVSYAAWFSTLSSFIYFPAIPTLAKDLGVSINKIDLTVTTYMAVATVAPMLVGDAAEIWGRRPIYAVTLTLYFGANLAIALTRSYRALLALRALQALAISGNVAVDMYVVGPLPF